MDGVSRKVRQLRAEVTYKGVVLNRPPVTVYATAFLRTHRVRQRRPAAEESVHAAFANGSVASLRSILRRSRSRSRRGCRRRCPRRQRMEETDHISCQEQSSPIYSPHRGEEGEENMERQRVDERLTIVTSTSSLTRPRQQRIPILRHRLLAPHLGVLARSF